MFSLSSFAQDMDFNKETGKVVPKYVGELKIFKGRVFKTTAKGKTIEVRPGERFYKDEILKPEDQSMAKLLIVDDTILSVGANTQLHFEDFSFIDKDNRRIVYSLLKGQLAGHVKIKAKEDEIIIKTKNATLGVRGTKILVNHKLLNKNLEISQFALLSGSAQVTDSKNKNLKHMLEQSDKVIIAHDNATQERADEKGRLTDEEFLKLDAKDVNEDLEFKPFMPYLEPKAIQPDSSLYSLLSKPSSAADNANDEGTAQKKKTEPKGTFQNLKKLNEKLRENQKKK